LHHVLDRKDLADLVIPDLARWSDWSQINRLVDLFVKADPDNNWVRVPVVNYLRACPLPEAKQALKKLEEVDPESVRRANTFFSIPVPSREPGEPDSSSSVDRNRDRKLAGGFPAFGGDLGKSDFGNEGILTRPGQPIAAIGPLAAGQSQSSGQEMNPSRLAYVLGLALATVMIVQFLLLSGGAQPSKG
jgi:hypothetical protein